MAQPTTESTSYLWLAAAVVLLLWWRWKAKKATTAETKPVIPLTVRPDPVETPAVVTHSDPETVIPPGVEFTNPNPSTVIELGTGTGTSYQSFDGYGMGDFSDAALAALARQSQWYLNGIPFDGHNSLWQAWVDNRGDGINGPPVGSQAAFKESVRSAIDSAFSGYNALVDSMQNPVPDSFQGW